MLFRSNSGALKGFVFWGGGVLLVCVLVVAKIRSKPWGEHPVVTKGV